jgi:hypothetical protein
MKTTRAGILTILAIVALAGCQGDDESANNPVASEESTEHVAIFQVPVRYHELDNGLKVILSQDLTSPIVTVAVYYHRSLPWRSTTTSAFALSRGIAPVSRISSST